MEVNRQMLYFQQFIHMSDNFFLTSGEAQTSINFYFETPSSWPPNTPNPITLLR